MTDFLCISTIITHLVTVIRIEILAQEVELHFATAEIWFFTISDYRVQGMHVLGLAFICDHMSIFINKEIITSSVFRRVVQDAFGHLLVAPGSATLLCIPLKALRERIVDYKSDISFVDAHTKGNRCYNDLNLIVHPLSLDLLSAVIGDLSVVIITLNLIISLQSLS